MISKNSPSRNKDKSFFIEFAGTPNSGKNTQIEILADYLRDYRGLKVAILDEVYHSCMIKRNYKHRLFWMYAELIKNIMETSDEINVDVTIGNRSLFDTLAFFQLYNKQRHINQDEVDAFSKSLTAESLCGIEDVVILLTTTPEVSIKREMIYPRSAVADLAKKLDQWDPNPNSTLANEEGLKTINDCYDIVLEKYGKIFKNIFPVFDDGNKSIVEIADTIVSFLHPFFTTEKKDFSTEKLFRQRKSKKVSQLPLFTDWP